MVARDARNAWKRGIGKVEDYMIDYPNEYERQEKDVDYYRKLIENLQGYVQNLKNELFDARASGDILTRLKEEKASLLEEFRAKKHECEEWARKYNELVDENAMKLRNQGTAIVDAVAQYKQILDTYKKMYQDAVAELDKKS